VQGMRMKWWSIGVASLTLAGLGVATLPTSVSAEDQRVTIIDGPGSFNPVDPELGKWGYAPFHVSVVQGEKITFAAPAELRLTHSVTSIDMSEHSSAGALTQGQTFNSSPGGRDTLIAKGTEWELDTSGLKPDHYTYFCWFHPWMVGTLTVTAPAAESPATAEIEAPASQ
jgi:plastocyanin